MRTSILIFLAYRGAYIWLVFAKSKGAGLTFPYLLSEIAATAVLAALCYLASSRLKPAWARVLSQGAVAAALGMLFWSITSFLNFGGFSSNKFIVFSGILWAITGLLAAGTTEFMKRRERSRA